MTRAIRNKNTGAIPRMSAMLFWEFRCGRLVRVGSRLPTRTKTVFQIEGVLPADGESPSTSLYDPGCVRVSQRTPFFWGMAV